MKDVKTLTIQELLTALANSCKTYYGAGGHSKAENNKSRMGWYIDELKARGEKIPEDKELLEVGVFNGEGSY